MIRIEIPLKLPSLNEYIKQINRNKCIGSSFKKQIQNDISWFMVGIKPIEKPVKIRFTWHEANNKRDLDNICSAKKYILDSMVEMGILKNDTRKYVNGFVDEFPEPRGEYKVILEIEEAN